MKKGIFVTKLVSTLDIKLNTYFAVEEKEKEHFHNLVETIIKLAKAEGVLFRRIEVLDRIEVGLKNYFRMRTDLSKTDFLSNHFVKTGRNVIAWNGEFYEVLMPTKRVKISSSTMHSTPRLGIVPTLYKGPKVVGWESQFQSTVMLGNEVDLGALKPNKNEIGV